MIFGELVVTCPECDLEIPVPASLSVQRTESGTQVLAADWDDADVWAHAWAHDPELSDLA